jgi:PAS domain S-box-containing protein
VEVSDTRTPILLVDDQRANLLALEAVLGSPAYELVSVTSGVDALAELERREFAVILLDLQMPTMDGVETALKMRERATKLGRRAPIIFVTAIDIDRERILRAYSSGAVDFMQKPLEAAVLKAKVSVFAELYRARDRFESERRATEEEARRFRLLVESVKDYAIFILDPKGFVATWNAGAERIKGYTAGEVIGKHFAIFYPPEDVAAGKCEWELEVATREGRIEDEGWRVRKDGSHFWANVTITALRDPESGVLVGFAKVTRDLTARVQNEQQLRHLASLEARAAAEKEQRVRREFLAKAGEALMASTLDYRATLATVARLAVPDLADWCSVELLEPGAAGPSQVALAHADPSKVHYARELAERYPPEPNATRGAPQVIRSGKSELYPELPAAVLEAGARDAEHLRIIRELRLESAMVVPLSGRDCVLGAMTFIYADSGRRYTESDLSFAEEFARRAAMAIENAQAHSTLSSVLEFQERFVAILGHDLRNPLSAIDMGAGVLRQRAERAQDSDTTRVLDRMKASARRMERMIEQILDLTRSRIAGGLEMRVAETDLCVTLSAIVDELRAANPSRTIELRSPPTLIGMWDRDRLEQVFSNLVGNAISYGLVEKPVTLAAREEVPDGLVRVEVHNEGPPISEALQAKIFTPFRRGELDSKAAHTAGLGLGLYISHAIVAKHGGEIGVRSSSAEGTTFWVTLPRRTTTPPSE